MIRQNLQGYIALKSQIEAQEFKARGICATCRLAPVVCDCAHLKPFDPKIKFVILIHPEEVRRRIATGRLTHLQLKNSLMIEGEAFEENRKVTELLDDPAEICVVLYPGESSLNLSQATEALLMTHLPLERGLTVFVIDGTWRTAKKMLRLSPRLAQLQKVSFDLPHLSRFEIRKQPGQNCFSTIEAVHHLIELVGNRYGFSTASRKHDHLLELFDRMVDRQIDYQNRLGSRPRARDQNITRT